MIDRSETAAATVVVAVEELLVAFESGVVEVTVAVLEIVDPMGAAPLT